MAFGVWCWSTICICCVSRVPGPPLIETGARGTVACIAFVAPVCVGRLIAPFRLLPVRLDPVLGLVLAKLPLTLLTGSHTAQHFPPRDPPKGIPCVWRHMRGFLKSCCDSHAPSLNKFTSSGESFLRLYCSVRYVQQLKVTFHVCPYIPTHISRLNFAFATLTAHLPALKLRHQNDHIQNEPPGSRFNMRDGSIREIGLQWTGE